MQLVEHTETSFTSSTQAACCIILLNETGSQRGAPRERGQDPGALLRVIASTLAALNREHHAPVLGAAFHGVVVGDRPLQAKATPGQPGPVDPLLHQVRNHGFGAARRQPLVVGSAALIIGVALDLDVQLIVRRQHLRDAVEQAKRAWLDRSRAGERAATVRLR
jgi:hypothetical protein